MTEPFAKLRMALFCYCIVYFIALHCVFYCMELCILLCRRTRHTLSNFIIRNRAEIQAIIKFMVYSWCTN